MLKHFRGFLDRSGDSWGTGFLVQVRFFLFFFPTKRAGVCVYKSEYKCDDSVGEYRSGDREIYSVRVEC